MKPNTRESGRTRLLSTLAVGATFASVAAFSADAATPAYSPLVGSWQLVSYVDTPEGGAPVYPFGRNPVGLFVFTVDGHVSISIMRNPPDVGAPSEDADPDACIPSWYCAYFGTYTVDLAKGEWTTHVEGSNIPNYLKYKEQRRSFSIQDATMTIKESYAEGGKTVSALRVLIRERSR